MTHQEIEKYWRRICGEWRESRPDLFADPKFRQRRERREREARAARLAEFRQIIERFRPLTARQLESNCGPRLAPL